MKRRDKSEFDPPRSPSEGVSQSDGASAPDTDGTDDDFEAEDAGDATSAIEGPYADFERRLSDQEEKYLRLAAEYENYRKRTARERAELTSRAQAELVKQLVDALDDLAPIRPRRSCDGRCEPRSSQGVEMVEKKFLKTLDGRRTRDRRPGQSVVRSDAARGGRDGARPLARGRSRRRPRVPGRILFNGQLLRPARVVVKQWNG